jgi:hypothetical protein
MDLNRIDYNKVTIIDSASKINVQLTEAEINKLSDKTYRRLNPVLLIVALKGYLDDEGSDEYNKFVKRLKSVWRVKDLPETTFEDYRIYKVKLNPY